VGVGRVPVADLVWPLRQGSEMQDGIRSSWRTSDACVTRVQDPIGHGTRLAAPEIW